MSEQLDPLNTDLEKSKKVASKKNFNKIRKIFFVFLGACLGLLLVFYVLTWFFLNPYLKYQLEQTVASSSDSLYLLKIDKLNINFWNAAIDVGNAKLYRNPKRWQAVLYNKKDRNQIDIFLQVGQMQVKGIRWVHFIRTSELEIRYIFLKKPLIKFKNHIPQIASNQSLSTFQRIQDFAYTFTKKIHIKSIVIEKANISLDWKNSKGNIFHQGEEIDFKMQRLLIKPNSSKKIQENFEFGSFAIQSKSYHFNTPDKVYGFTFKDLKIDSQDSLLRAKDFQIKPISLLRLNQKQYLKKSATRLDMSFVNVLASGIDFRKILFQQAITSRSVQIVEGNVKIRQDNSVSDKKKLAATTQKSLKQILREIPIYIQLDTLKVSNALFQFVQNSPNYKQSAFHQADSINLSFYNLRLGKAIDANTARKALYSNKVDLKFRNYIFRSSDGLYEAFIKKAKISSLDSVISIEQAYLKPLVSKNDFVQIKTFQSTRVDAQLKSLIANKLDIERLAYQQEFVMQAIRLQEPIFDAYLDKTKPKQPTQQYQNFEQVLQSIPLFIIVDTFAIQKARFVYNELSKKGITTHKSENIHLQVLKIKLGQALEESALAQIDTKSLQLNFQNYSYQTPDKTHLFTLENVQVSSAQSFILIDSLQWKPLGDFEHKPQISIQIKQIKGQKIDFKRLLLRQEFDWKILQIISPDVLIRVMDTQKLPFEPIEKIEKDSLIHKILTASNAKQAKLTLRKLLAEIPVFIKVDTLEIQNANCTYFEENKKNQIKHEAKNIYCQIQNITLGEATKVDAYGNPQFYSDNLKIGLKNYQFTDLKNFYRLAFQNVSGSLVDSVLVVDEIDVEPLLSKEAITDKNPFRSIYTQAKLQSIAIREIDLDRLIFDNEFIIGYLSFNQPKLFFYTDLRKPKNPANESKTLEDWLRKIPFYVRVDSFFVKDAQITLEEQIQDKLTQNLGLAKHQIQTLNFDAYQMELGIAKMQTFDSERLLNSQNIALSIEDYTYTTANKQYKIGFDILQTHPLLDSSISIYGLYCKPQVSKIAFDSLNRFQKYYFDVKTDLLTARVADFRNLLSKKSFNLASLNLEDTDLSVYFNANLPKDTQVASKSIEQILNTFPVEISIAQMKFDKMKVHYEEKNTFEGKEKIFSQDAGEVDLTFKNLHIDNQNTSKEQFLYSEDVSLYVENYETYSKDSLYHYKIDTLFASSQRKDLQINGYHISPVPSKEEFTAMKDFRSDLYDVFVQHGKAKGLDFNKAFYEGALQMAYVVLDSVEVNVFNDLRLPRDPHLIPWMPNEAFQRIYFPLKIDSLHIINAFAQYSDITHIKTGKDRRQERRERIRQRIRESVKAKLQVKEGDVFFSDLDILCKNIDTQSPQKAMTIIDASGRLMGQGQLNVHVETPLNASRMMMNYSGSMETVRAEDLNDLFESRGNVRVKKGEIKKINFIAVMQDTIINGQLNADYNHIRIEVLNPKNTEKKKRFLSFLANLIIRNNNVLGKRRFRAGIIQYIRKRQDSFINLLWRSIGTGLVDTLK